MNYALTGEDGQTKLEILQVDKRPDSRIIFVNFQLKIVTTRYFPRIDSDVIYRYH
jgi:hypothetical protein